MLVSLRSFLTSLSESGRVEVAVSKTPFEQVAGEADDLLLAFDRLAREQMAFTAPVYVPDVARWAAELMYRGCQLLVYRQLDAEMLKEALNIACPQPLSAAVVYSADLLLRYVGDLLTMARAVAEQDVLVTELLRIAAAWPLSSLGITHVAADQLESRAIEIIMADRSLRQLYIDRIIARRDASRLAHAGVRDGVREAIGQYDELWPDRQ